MASEKSKRWLEWMIALILVSIVVLVFFQKIQKVVIVAERESVNQCLSSIRVGIQLFILSDIVRGKVADMRAYENSNPIQFQKEPPPNYAGEFGAEEAANVRDGQWYYDTSANQLVYRVSHYPLFNNDYRKELRYRLQFSESGDNNPLKLRLLAVEKEG